MLTLHFCYLIAGAIFSIFALISVGKPDRYGNVIFWGLLALSFLAGDYLGDLGNGVLVVALVIVAGTGRLRNGDAAGPSFEERTSEAARRGNALFLPALIIPATALAGTLLLPHVPGLADPKQVTLISLTIGVLLALAACYIWLRPKPATPFRDGHRLLEQVGWAAILPQMLASLGAVFALSGVGDAVGTLIGGAIPAGNLLGAVLAYGIGMALFTMVMGNAFAAFPVMAGAVGIPVLIHSYHGNPAAVCALGMLCGFCGTLMTPMAANFNLVPAALLELKDRYGVIRAQVATALPMLGVNVGILYYWGF